MLSRTGRPKRASSRLAWAERASAPATRPRSPATSRADALWSVGVAGLSVALVAFGLVLLLLAQHDMRNARAQLASTLFAEARAEQRSPRDPHVLAAVARQLPRDVRLVPSRDVMTTGRVEVVSRRLHTAGGRLCLVLPDRINGRIARCGPPTSRHGAVRRRTLPLLRG